MQLGEIVVIFVQYNYLMIRIGALSGETRTVVREFADACQQAAVRGLPGSSCPRSSK
ncbi:MAG TPA: hypothetical protein VN379_22795 [Sporomusa sp.]|nr:hypothetical protein [Sporomusa sp.]